MDILPISAYHEVFEALLELVQELMGIGKM